MRKVVQAKHIPTDEILAVIGIGDRPLGLLVLQETFGEYPPKVVLAKLRGLIRGKKIAGCGCGCRGDFRISDS